MAEGQLSSYNLSLDLKKAPKLNLGRPKLAELPQCNQEGEALGRRLSPEHKIKHDDSFETSMQFLQLTLLLRQEILECSFPEFLTYSVYQKICS